MFVRWLLFLCVIGSLNADYYTSGGGRPCVLPRLDHGRVRVRQRSMIVKFSCLPRYELVGNRYATCKDGDWDAPLPVCVRAGCEIPKVRNGLSMDSRNGAWVMYFCLPNYRLVGSRVIFCDGRLWNATAPTCASTNTESALSCDFENGLCGWVQDDLHDFDWLRHSYRTPSSFLQTGPSFDHTYGPEGTGYYMYIESTARETNDTARFISPVYDRTLADDGCFSFFYHMYGRTIGGLRVYQKPDNISLDVLVHLNDEEKSKYILFEKWGSLGNFWFSSVSTLTQFNDNFQIVIEGIRGRGFTSDIAIDDVAILQGVNCTRAKNVATTPSSIPFQPDSCSGRCHKENVKKPPCGCTTTCLINGTCCPDFFDICLFIPDTTTPDDMIPANSPDDTAPITQRLVATSTESTSSTTSTTTTRKPTTTKTTTLSPRPITTPRPTTTPKTTTTRKPTTVTTTSAPTVTPKSVEARTLKVTTITTLKHTESTSKATTKSTTNIPFGISRTIENHNVYHELVDKAQKEQNVETRKIGYTNKKDSGKSGSNNGWKVALAIVGALSCVSFILVVIMARTTRGRITIAGLRGRISNDPNVQFLIDDVDDL